MQTILFLKKFENRFLKTKEGECFICFEQSILLKFELQIVYKHLKN